VPVECVVDFKKPCTFVDEGGSHMTTNQRRQAKMYKFDPDRVLFLVIKEAVGTKSVRKINPLKGLYNLKPTLHVST
jgi:hypothetical protein